MFNKKLYKDISEDQNNSNSIEILLEDWQRTKDKKIMDSIINKHILLIHKIARGYISSKVEMEDLISEGIIGLIHGMEKFQSHHNTKFSTYAYFWIKSKINTYVWKMRNLINVPFSNKNNFMFSILNKIQNEKISYEEGVKLICEKENLNEEHVKNNLNILNYKINILNKKINHDNEKEISWDNLLENDDHSEMIHELETKNIEKLIKRSMMILSDKERIVINKRFLKEEPDTLKELAEKLNMTSEGVRNIEIRAIKKLKEEFLVNTNNLQSLNDLRLIFIFYLLEETL
jgi:RNA polymerase sigma factor (sigma-70 family)